MNSSKAQSKGTVDDDFKSGASSSTHLATYILVTGVTVTVTYVTMERTRINQTNDIMREKKHDESF